MEILAEFYKLALKCLALLRIDDPTLLIGAVLAGVTVGVLLWFGCHLWANLWNKGYALKPLHHVLAAVVLVLATVYAVSYVSLKYTSRIVEAEIQSWQESISMDNDLKTELCGELYDQISAKGLEDMSRIPDPRSIPAGERWIFTYKHDETKVIVAQVYTDGALHHFQKNHPLISKLLSADVSPELIVNDINVKTKNSPDSLYNLEDASRLIATVMAQTLQTQIWRVVMAVRLILLAVFLLWLLIPLTLIAIAAYKDIRVYRFNKTYVR